MLDTRYINVCVFLFLPLELQLQLSMVFLVLVWHRFKKKLKKWYNLNDAQQQEQWDLAIRDPTVKKGVDMFGNTTVCKLATSMSRSGRDVGLSNKVSEEKIHALDTDDLSTLREGLRFSIQVVSD